MKSLHFKNRSYFRCDVRRCYWSVRCDKRDSYRQGIRHDDCLHCARDGVAILGWYALIIATIDMTDPLALMMSDIKSLIASQTADITSQAMVRLRCPVTVALHDPNIGKLRDHRARTK